MDSLRKKIDKIKPHFMEGGKFGKLRSVFEGFESFLFVSDKVTFKGSHIRDSIDLKRTMTVVIIALMPALLFGAYNVGLQHFRSIGSEAGTLQMFWFGFLKILPLIVVSYTVGLGIEFIAAQIRGHEINEGFLVTGLLIPLIMPIDIPLWMLALATAFAVIIGKEVFGGTGMNVFNPALIARAFLFFSYPGWMTGDKVWIEGLTKGQNVIDGFSGATPLALCAAGETTKIPSFMDMFLGTIPGSIGETSTLAILIGAVYTHSYRHRKLEDNCQCFCRRTGNGLAFECPVCKCLYGSSCILSFCNGRFRFRSSFYGYRPGIRSPDRKGEMDLRFYDWSVINSYQGDKPCLSRRCNACNTAYECLCTSD